MKNNLEKCWMEINSLNYLATYKWKLNNNRERIVTNGACFSSLYGESRIIPNTAINSGTISIKVYFSKEMNDGMVDNYCLLNESELSEYIKWIKKITKFNVRIYKRNDIRNNYLNTNHKVITLRFTKKTPYEIRLICALIRNLYECPYNIMVKTAFLLKNNAVFENMDFTERFCMAINSISGYNTGHSTFRSDGVDIYNDKSLRKRYLKAAKTEMNVNGFMLKSNKIKLNRFHLNSHKENNDNDDEGNIFDSLEEGVISEEFMDIITKNYEIIKENYGQ